MSKTKQPIKNIDAELSSDEESSVAPKGKVDKKVTKKVVKKDSDDESSEVQMLKTKKARANSSDKPAAKKVKKVAVESDSDESSVKPKKTNGTKKPVAKKQADSDDESSVVAPKKAATKVAPKKKVESDDESSVVAPKKAAAKVAPKKKVESDDESSEEVAPKKTAAKTAPKKKVESDSDESSEEVVPKKAVAKPVAKKQVDSDDEEEVVVAVPQKQFQQQEYTEQSDCSELFVKNLSWNTDENKLYEHFSQFGNVESQKVLYDRTTGKARGLGFVKFSTRAEAEAALSKTHEVDGRTIQASFSDNKDAGRGNNQQQGGRTFGGNQGGFQKVEYDGEKHTIFVGNLGFKTAEGAVAAFFKDCGRVVDVRIAKDRDTGRMKGFCHVDFDTSDAVEKAKSKAGQELDGREIRVDASVPREGGASRGGRGGGRGGFRGGRGGSFGNPLDRAKKSGGIIQPTGQTVTTFDDDE